MKEKIKGVGGYKVMRTTITKFKLKIFGLKDLALILFILALNVPNGLGVWGFVLSVIAIIISLTAIDKAIEKEVNDWLGSKDCEINTYVEKK